MSASSICVVGTDATMVYDAVRNVVDEALGALDPTVALEDFVARDSSAGEPSTGRLLDALYTPAMLVERRVVVVRDAQYLSADEAKALQAWMASPTPETVLVLAVVGAKTNKLVKAADVLVDVNVGSRQADRHEFVAGKFAQYGVTADRTVVATVVGRVGDDLARVDALARTLHSIYGTAPLTVGHVEPYLGDPGGVPEWDLTDAIDAGDASRAITVARRMLDSKGRAGLQIVNLLQRHFLRLARLSGASVRDADEAASLLGIKAFPAGKALAAARRLGDVRVVEAVRLITRADLDLKGGVTFGSGDDSTAADATELMVIEVLVARLARLSASARR
ncbi:MAG: hypothetical protein KGJ92_06775 [Actinomycetales bacterium]|nr:hypothetical protein [Actinomycetales bacterium]